MKCARRRCCSLLRCATPQAPPQRIIKIEWADLRPDLSVLPMFGGFGVYRNEVVFALIIQDTLFLKGYPENVEVFEAAGSTPFQYTGKGGKLLTMNYWRLPESAMDDPDEAVEWARMSLR